MRNLTYHLALITFLGVMPLVLDAAETAALRDALVVGAKVRSQVSPELLFETARKQESQLAGTNLRVIRGKHLHLITDLPGSKEIDRLPQVFDAAVPYWAEFFRLEYKQVEDWKMLGVLVGDHRRFTSTTLFDQLLKHVPNLQHGFSVGNWLWIREQESDYYRRHLLLHEGVHGFVNHFFGSCGPNWYMEGVAELLGTHSWNEETGVLTVPYFPVNRDAVPLWGRIRILNDLRDKNQPRGIASVLTMSFDGADNTPSYAWSWGLAAFLNGHPLYGDLLRDAVTDVSLSHAEFTRRFRTKLEAIQSGRVHVDWSDFLARLEYGYDFERNAIKDLTPGKPLQNKAIEITVQADQGWQNAGILVEKGKTYSFQATGRFQLAQEGDKIWWSEPNGVTIRYYQGRPLGLLLGAVLPAQKGAQFILFPIGETTSWTAPETGTLFFRINDGAAELQDNSGTVAVRIANLL